MRAAFIGGDPKIADLATLAISLRWPEATPFVVTSAAEVLDMIARESLDVVLLHSDLGDRSLAQCIRDIRELTHVPLLVLADQGDETEVVPALEAAQVRLEFAFAMLFATRCRDTTTPRSRHRSPPAHRHHNHT